jgi:SAM-dependent methyltransferase
MPSALQQEGLLSHSFASESLDASKAKIAARIQQEGDKPYATVAYQLTLLDELAQFEFGRFLLLHQGLNGFWTHYMLTHPWFGRKKNSLSPLESFILDKAPVMLATQQRFGIFLQENQKAVKNGVSLACIPCGMMGELLYLDLQGIDACRLVGIDYDPNTLKDAQSLAEQRGLSSFIELQSADAWALDIENQFDLISSNGLTIYEASDEKVVDLYRRFYKALKPGGKLVASFLTYPPGQTDVCEWDMSQIKAEDVLKQKIIFVDILQAKWQCFRSSEQTLEQLRALGYENIDFIYDPAKLFPTVVAYKKTTHN